MTVVEHLTELRRRVIVSLVGFVFAASLSYWFAPDIIRFFLHYYTDATSGRQGHFIFTGPIDAFVTRLKVATYAGIVGALPVWLWELWRFITPVKPLPLLIPTTSTRSPAANTSAAITWPTSKRDRSSTRSSKSAVRWPP